MKKLGLLLLAVMMISLSSCGDAADKAKEGAKNATEKATDAVKEGAEKTADAVKEGAEKATEAVKEGAEEVAEKATDAVKEGAEKVADAVKSVDGEALFTSNGCTACHNMTAKTVGPAIVEIAKGYAGKKDDLVKFLKGEGEAIVDPAQFAVMQPQLNTTKKMSDEERSALADYFLAAK